MTVFHFKALTCAFLSCDTLKCELKMNNKQKKIQMKLLTHIVMNIQIILRVMWFLMVSQQNKLILLRLKNVVLCRAPLQQHHIINIKIYDIFYRCQKKIVGLAIWIIVFNHITVSLCSLQFIVLYVAYSRCIIYMHVFMHA